MVVYLDVSVDGSVSIGCLVVQYLQSNCKHGIEFLVRSNCISKVIRDIVQVPLKMDGWSNSSGCWWIGGETIHHLGCDICIWGLLSNSLGDI